MKKKKAIKLAIERARLSLLANTVDPLDAWIQSKHYNGSINVVVGWAPETSKVFRVTEQDDVSQLSRKPHEY